MELVSRGGATFFVLVADRECLGITNFSRWEQAFRIFSNLYTRCYPERASELVQYNHVIYMAATTYEWDDVYTYDREFRTHLNHYPQRSWSVILQQAWAMYLKNKLVKGQDDPRASGPPNNRDGEKSKKICKRFNKGKCNKGFSCRFEHRCFGCGKMGHGVHICRKKGNSGQQTGEGSKQTNRQN